MLQSSSLYSCFSSSYLGNLSAPQPAWKPKVLSPLISYFCYSFSILGMNLFGCKFCDRHEDGTKSNCDRKNFDSLLWATVTVFQVSLLSSYVRCYHQVRVRQLRFQQTRIFWPDSLKLVFPVLFLIFKSIFEWSRSNLTTFWCPFLQAIINRVYPSMSLPFKSMFFKDIDVFAKVLGQN